MIVDVSKFAAKSELFAYLVANKKELIAMKTGVLKNSDLFGVDETLKNTPEFKALTTRNEDDVESGVIKRTIIGNTYNWMDSHGDVHADGIFAKSISEREGKIWHLADHEFKITAKVGTFSNIYEKSVRWADLGIQKFGYTQALFGDSVVSEEMNKQIFKGYLKGEINQHSVGMIYVKIDLAINDPEYKTEFALYNKMIPLIGNKDKAEKQGFFWVVKEAKLREISAVLEGSNELTNAIENIDPAAANQKSENIDVELISKARKKAILLNN